MRVRNGLWIGGIAIVAALGGVAAYSAADPTILPGLRAAGSPTTPAAEPVRRTSRIDGDMKATFERLEKSGAEARATATASRPAPIPSTNPRPQSADQAEKATSAPKFAGAPVTSPSSAPSAPVALSKPAKGMPVSLVPAPREAAAAAPRVMDPRLTRTLDQLGTGPRATVAALPDAAPAMAAPVAAEAVSTIASDAVPTVLSSPVAAAAKNESDMTAEELNLREHQRIRKTLEGASGGTN